jgi:hypothetical protein
LGKTLDTRFCRDDKSFLGDAIIFSSQARQMRHAGKRRPVAALAPSFLRKQGDLARAAKDARGALFAPAAGGGVG